MPTGVEFANVIDVAAHDPETDEIALIMMEPRPWDGSDLRIFQLQEKINAYLSFALDGEMAEELPHLKGKPLRLQLDSATEPDPRTASFIEMVREQIAYQDIRFIIRVMEADAPCKSCSCGEHDHDHPPASSET